MDGGVHHIAIAANFFDLVFSGLQFSRELNDAVLVGHIFVNQIAPAIVEVEHRPIDGFLGFGVDLGEAEGSQGFVEQLYCALLPPGQGHLVDGFVQLVPGQGLDLLQVKGFAAIYAGEQDLPQLIGGEGPHLPVELVIHPDLDALHRLAGIRVQLDDLEDGIGLVAELEDIELAALQLDGPGGGVRLVPLRRLDLGHLNPDLLLVRQVDDACLIGVVGADGAAVDLLDVEAYIGDGFAGNVVHLSDLQPGAGLVEELHHGGSLIFQLHQLGFPGGDVGRVSPYLGDQVPAGGHILSGDHRHPVLPGDELSHQTAIRVAHLKDRVGDRLPGDRVLFGDDEWVLGSVFHLEDAALVFIQLQLMDRLVQQVARQGPYLFGEIDLTRLQVLQDDFSLCIGGELPQALAVLDADLKHNALQRLEGDAVDLLNGEGGLFAVFHHQLGGFTGDELDVVMGVVGDIPRRAAQLIDLVPVLLQILEKVGPVRPGGHVHILGGGAPGNPEHRPGERFTCIRVDLGDEELGLGKIPEDHRNIFIDRLRFNEDGLYIVFIQEVSIGRLGFNDGVILAAFQLLDGHDSIFVRLKISQKLGLLRGCTLVKFKNRPLQALTCDGVHLFDGEPRPGVVAEFQLHRLMGTVIHIDGVYLVGGQVKLGRGGFLDPVLARDHVLEDGDPIRPGGAGIDQAALVGLGVRPEQGGLDDRPLKRLAGLVVPLGDDDLGFFVVGDGDLLVLALLNHYLMGGDLPDDIA